MQSDEILLRARRLDMSALAQIHDRFYTEVFRYVRYRLDDERACEDIASEVFLRLLDALHKRRGPNQNLRGWLFGTASNLVNDHLRHRYQHVVEELHEDEEDFFEKDHPESTFVDRWEAHQVRQALMQLTSEQQHVLALRFADELSLEETAAVMEKSVNAVKALQFRAIASLRRIFEDQFQA
jgi:RNA polymerase sigma-70 factor (ECF subfamily)